MGKLSEALFDAGAATWAARMRRVLKEDRGGIQRALNYLWKYRDHMNYWECRRSKLPIGSGVTEAACKMILGHRFKQSGILWKQGHSQCVFDPRG